ncbi:MAG TPA: ABC transporter substrate-binding protein, partial [Actinomycetes bacterium]
MTKFRRLPAALVALLLLVAAGCSNKSGSGGGGETSKPLVIGASLPLSGDFSQPGEASHRGYTIWQEMVNKNGGLLKR